MAHNRSFRRLTFQSESLIETRFLKQPYIVECSIVRIQADRNHPRRSDRLREALVAAHGTAQDEADRLAGRGHRRAQATYAPAFQFVPIVLMEQDGRGVPTYYGRPDIVRFLASIDFRRLPWKQWILN
jgi:hypothetical protein